MAINRIKYSDATVGTLRHEGRFSCVPAEIISRAKILGFTVSPRYDNSITMLGNIGDLYGYADSAFTYDKYVFDVVISYDDSGRHHVMVTTGNQWVVRWSTSPDYSQEWQEDNTIGAWILRKPPYR